MKKRKFLVFIALLPCFIGFITMQAENLLDDFLNMFIPATQQPYFLHNQANHCDTMGPLLRVKYDLARVFDMHHDAHNLHPHQKDKSGRTVGEIAMDRYKETGNRYCERFAQEYEKYRQKHEQKQKEQK